MSKPPLPARLMRTVVPHGGEDIRSVAVRYAKLKRLTVADLMVAGLGAQEAHLTSVPLKTALIQRFADLAGLDAAVLRAEAFGSAGTDFELFGSPASVDMTVPHRRRIAPGILRADGDEPWVRAHWQVACLPCDPDTGETLLHLCPQCGATLSWMWVKDLHRCDRCRVDLREAEPRYASARDRELSALMLGLLRREPSAIERMPPMVAGATPAEQVQFFSWLGSLRALVNGVVLPDGPFVTFRGLEATMSFPGSFNRMVLDLMAAHEERDPRFGRLVGAMELRFRCRELMGAKIKASIRQRLDRLLQRDEVKGLIMMPFSGTAAGVPSHPRAFKFDYQTFLWSTHRASDVWHRALSGLAERRIPLAS